MKTNQIIIAVCICLANSLFMNAQRNQAETFLQETVSRMKQAGTPQELIDIRNTFERISLSYPDEWLAVYYQGLCNINLFFRTPEQEKGEQYLKEAKICLDNLKRKKGLSKAALSEITTLRSYWYYALMAQNPQVNGPLYSNPALSSLGEALKLNPENPRAILLNALLQNNISAFMGSSYANLENDKEKALLLYSQEDSNGLFPNWLPYH